MADLSKIFDRVIVVSLRRRMDRLGQFWQRLEKTGWPFKHPVVFDAIDGELVPVPAGVGGGNQWKSGGGAWGCMQSHRQILERAIIDGVESLLVLEDDAWPIDGFMDRTEKFFGNLPTDWEGLMLGGQHMGGTPTVASGIVKCHNCQRTHAYSVRGKYMRDLYALWQSYFGHCDHVMGPFQARYKVYSPEPFLIGQGSTRSDISGKVDPIRFWSGSDNKAEIAIIDTSKDVLQKLRSYGVHSGYHRDGPTDVDMGIKNIFIDNASDSYINKVRKLREWGEMVRGEASVFENGICVIWMPSFSTDIVRVCDKAFGNELIKLRVTSVEDFLEKRKIMSALPILFMIAVATTQPDNPTEDFYNLGSITGVIAVTFVVVEGLKKVITTTTPILGKIPVIFFPVLVSMLLALLANQVMKRDDGIPILSGNVWTVLGRAILGAASTSGLYTWLRSPGTTIGDAQPLIGSNNSQEDTTMKPNFLLLILVALTLSLLVGCSNTNPEKIAVRETMYSGTATIRANEAAWAAKLVAYPTGTTDPRTGQPSDGKNKASEITPLTPAQYKQDQATQKEFEDFVAADRAHDSGATTQP